MIGRDDGQLRQQPMNAPGPLPPTINGVVFKKFLTLKCALRREKDALIETKAGVRMKVAYEGVANGVYAGSSEVALDGATLEAFGRAPNSTVGKVKSGGDWMFIRSDGVMFSDAHFTLAFPTSSANTETESVNFIDPFLIDATFKGSVDLTECFRVSSGEEAYRKFVDGLDHLHAPGRIVGSFRFEAADLRVLDDLSWLPKHLKKSTIRFDEFRLLLRQQFLGVGALTLRDGPYCPPERIEIEAWGA